VRACVCLCVCVCVRVCVYVCGHADRGDWGGDCTVKHRNAAAKEEKKNFNVDFGESSFLPGSAKRPCDVIGCTFESNVDIKSDESVCARKDPGSRTHT